MSRTLTTKSLGLGVKSRRRSRSKWSASSSIDLVPTLLSTSAYGDDQRKGRMSSNLHVQIMDTIQISMKGSIKVMGTLALLAIPYSIMCSMNMPNPGFIDMPATTPYNDIVIAHCTEDLKWLDQLHNFDPLVCSHTRIYIYSKCNAEINLTEVIPLSAKCSTVKQVNNCGTQEYAYFQFILDHYETMSPMVSFIQGDSLTENPHIIYDMMVHILGTTYKDLSRHVRDGWHMKRANEVDIEIMRNSFPYSENKTTWLTSWRSMFAASREQIKLHPQQVYLDINTRICSGACGFIHCNMEVYFAPFFGCDPEKKNPEQCEFGVSHGISPKVFAEDHLKDAYSNTGLSDEAIETHWSRCGNKVVYHSASTLNGVLLCIDESSSSANSESSRLRELTVNSYSEMVLNEKWMPNLSNQTFKKPSQWASIYN